MTDKPFLLTTSDDGLTVINLSLVRTAFFRRDGFAELNFDGGFKVDITDPRLVDRVSEILSESCLTGSGRPAKDVLAELRPKSD